MSCADPKATAVCICEILTPGPRQVPSGRNSGGTVKSCSQTSGQWAWPVGRTGLAAWFGLVAGLLEVLTKVSCTAIGRSGQLYQMSRHFFWLIPVTNLLVFLGLGLFLAFLVWVMPRFGRWLSVRGLGALTLLPSLLVAVPEVYSAAWLSWRGESRCGSLRSWMSLPRLPSVRHGQLSLSRGRGRRAGWLGLVATGSNKLAKPPAHCRRLVPPTSCWSFWTRFGLIA